jgi:glycosyltransferase involved in cell wall biosynthesis
LLEAAAAGCAVVTTDTVGCRESVQPGISGDLVPVRDPQALARALLELIDDPARQAAYGDAGRKLARQRFGLDSVVASTLATYEQLGAASAH